MTIYNPIPKAGLTQHLLNCSCLEQASKLKLQRPPTSDVGYENGNLLTRHLLVEPVTLLFVGAICYLASMHVALGHYSVCQMQMVRPDILIIPYQTLNSISGWIDVFVYSGSIECSDPVETQSTDT